jgi:hypothetical protein
VWNWKEALKNTRLFVDVHVGQAARTLVALEATRIVPRLAGEFIRSVSLITALRKFIRPRSSHSTALGRLWHGFSV